MALNDHQPAAPSINTNKAGNATATMPLSSGLFPVTGNGAGVAVWEVGVAAWEVGVVAWEAGVTVGESGVAVAATWTAGAALAALAALEAAWLGAMATSWGVIC